MKSNEIRKIANKVAGTIGYELYAKGADRVVVQCQRLSDAAEELAKNVRKEDNPKKRKKLFDEVNAWNRSINGEVDMLRHDLNSEFDEYK